MNDLQPTAAVSTRMRRTKQRDNAFERSIRSLLYAQGVRFRLHYPLPGLSRITCDFAIPNLKIAVFLDGCFWHGCEIHPPSVKKNAVFWLEKIERNRARDRMVSHHMESIGWAVLRFWEHENAESIVEAILSAVSREQAHRRTSRAR